MRALLPILFLVAACDAETRPRPKDAVPGSPGLSLPVDRNADPRVLEVELEARVAPHAFVEGREITAWTYGGAVPGPLLDARVGDELVIHFKNALPHSTTIHWHGIRLPNAMDGSHAVQNPVPAGGSFDYRFRLRDPGVYWYHPHHRSDEQTERGLYGVIRVRGPNEPEVDAEHVLVLDDIELTDSKIADVDDYHALSDHEKLHGRAGSTILVNGQANRPIEVRAGALERFRFVNVANLRTFALRIPGHRFRVIGTDGGLFTNPYDAEVLVVSPSERWDALLIPNGPRGGELELRSDAFERAEHDQQEATLVTKLRIANVAPLTGRVLPDTLPGATPPRIAVPAGDPLPIDFDFGTAGGIEGFTLPPMHHDPLDIRPGEPIFVINGKAGSDIPELTIPLGETRAFRVANVSHQLHVFHLHGSFFQIVDTSDQFGPDNPFGFRTEAIAQAHKDSILVREGHSVTVVARFEDPGTWMYHCHVPEHSERGMMGQILVR